MIWTITPNPALDITYFLDTLDVGGVSRVERLAERPGGKGLNVARVLDSLEVPVVATGFLGGADGARVAALLTTLSPAVAQSWVEGSAPTRRSIAVVENDARTTVINEPGGERTVSEWEALDGVLAAVRPGDVVAISGSMPPATPADQLPHIVTELKKAEALVVVDTSGPALLAAASAGADLVKPNRDELIAATGDPDIMNGVRELLRRGAGIVALSLGEEGMMAAARDGEKIMVARARPKRVVQGNPTGAGDASVAAWVREFASRPQAHPVDLITGVGEAVALSAAAVARPVAGEIDMDEWEAQRDPAIEMSSHDW